MIRSVTLISITTLALLAASRVGAAEAKDPREAEVRRLIDRYFLSWSNQDLERYGQCFEPRAAIQLLGPDGALTTMALGPFLQSQRESHRQAANRLSETAEKVDVRFEGKIARVVVYWKLVNGEAVEFGYDHFTLINAGGRWRIANLLFYAEPQAPEPDSATAPAGGATDGAP